MTVDQRVEQLLARIWSGVNLDEIASTEGNIQYCHLHDIYQNANPQFYTEWSQHMDDNYKQPCLEDFNSQDEEEGEEEIPLYIPEPLNTGTHSGILPSEHNSGEQSSENMRETLERHLGTIIEETFQERTTPEWPP